MLCYHLDPVIKIGLSVTNLKTSIGNHKVFDTNNYGCNTFGWYKYGCNTFGCKWVT